MYLNCLYKLNDSRDKVYHISFGTHSTIILRAQNKQEK